MSNGNPNNIRVGAGKLFFGTVGAVEPTDLTTAWDAAWVPIGYTEEGHTATIAPSFDPIEVAEELVPVDYRQSKEEISLAFSSAELTALNIDRALNGGTLVAVPTLGTSPGTVTFATTGNLVTVSAAHGLAVGDRVQFGTMTTTASVVAGTTYYVKTVPSATTLTLSATSGGSTLTIDANGSSTFIKKVTAQVTTITPPAIGSVTYVAIGWEAADSSERWVYRKCLQTGSVAIARKKAPNKALIPMDFKVVVPVGGSAPFVAIISETY